MGWNTGFNLITDLNKGSSLLMVLKLNVWQRVCSVVGLDTTILIGTRVWGLEGAKKVLKSNISHFFFKSYIIGHSKNSDLENSMKFRGALFFLWPKM